MEQLLLVLAREHAVEDGIDIILHREGGANAAVYKFIGALHLC